MPPRFIDLERQHSDAYATAHSHFDLMWSSEELSSDTVQMVGRSGFKATQEMQEAFETLLGMYLEEIRGRKEHTANAPRGMDSGDSSPCTGT